MSAETTNDAKTRDNLNWAVLAHLSSFLTAWLALGFLGPLVVWLTKGKESEFVRNHAVAAVNFNLTTLFGIFLGVLFMFVIGIVGMFVLAVIGLMYLVETIRGAKAASKGKSFTYATTIEIFK